MTHRQPTVRQARDTGMAFTLLFLLASFYRTGETVLLPALGFLVITMTRPGVLTPLARLWFGLSGALGAIVSKILLGLIFYLLVSPIGYLRRRAGKDPMRDKQFRAKDDSVFVERNHRFTARDVTRPY